MSTEEQRIAIAQACGWKYHAGAPMGSGAVVNPWEHPRGGYYSNCPDYCNSLNAMHEAEKVLDENQQLVYGSRLYEITGAYNQETQRREGWKEIHSTAAQRAEAFLKTMNLWKE